MRHVGCLREHFDDVGFSVYSEFDEDGILLYIFSLIDIANKTVVDIGAGGINGSNTANLIVNHGWKGFLIDGSQSRVKELQDYYHQQKETKHYPPKVIHSWVTRENINDLLECNGVSGDVDLLSLDIDGIDYWVLKEISQVKPRVILLEYQCIWGPNRAVTVPYDQNFSPVFDSGYGIYSGASLKAFVKLLKHKGEHGYRLVGCHRYGFNAFFVRNDVGADRLPEIDIVECFNHPFTQWAREKFLGKIKDLPWDEV